jgi:hypothetical protein
MRFFNTEGPVDCARHYCLPPLSRLDLDDVLALIAQQKYFLLHAPRQSGKTTCLLALADYLNERGEYHAVYANIEAAQVWREDVAQGIATAVTYIAQFAADRNGDAYAVPIMQEVLASSAPGTQLGIFLARWCEQLPKPLVLLLDEVDSLIGDTLISLLRQLRAGYPNRPRSFPHTVVLCGVRDIQDYRIESAEGKAVITGGSAFNIKAKSLRLGDFNRLETNTLLFEHTVYTGQTFDPQAIELIWTYTEGQPWLVNALAYEVTWEMRANRDRSRPVSVDDVHRAKENLILRRVTHIDQLAAKLREPRVQRVLESILVGNQEPATIPPEDISYVRDLGLITTEGQLRIANPIYQEVIPRELTYSTQLTISEQPAWYVLPDGRLDLPKLLTNFQQFFREHFGAWLEGTEYKEAGPQLLLQAFLQRIVNGGGRVDREYGLGRRRTDLLISWPYRGGTQRAVIELKLLYNNLEQTIAAGLAQTWEYADASGADEAHLVIFDRTSRKPWAEKIWVRHEQYRNLPITVWGV